LIEGVQKTIKRTFTKIEKTYLNNFATCG